MASSDRNDARSCDCSSGAGKRDCIAFLCVVVWRAMVQGEVGRIGAWIYSHQRALVVVWRVPVFRLTPVTTAETV